MSNLCGKAFSLALILATVCIGAPRVWSAPVSLAAPDIVSYFPKDIFFQHQFLRTNLLENTVNGDLEGVKYSIEKEHADVNQTDDNGTTSLILAAGQGHLNIVKYLVGKRGYIEGTNIKAADVNQTNENGISPLMIAALMGKTDVVTFLVTPENHADVNQTDFTGNNALIFAVLQEHPETVKALLTSKKIDVNEPNTVGDTALIYAAQQPNADIVEMLVKDKRTDINHPNQDGVTALIYAAQEGNVKAVEHLITVGHADTEKTITLPYRESGQEFLLEKVTALMLAADHGHLEVITTLVEKGNANVNATTNNGLTALTFAEKAGHTKIADYLRAHMHQ